MPKKEKPLPDNQTLYQIELKKQLRKRERLRAHVKKEMEKRKGYWTSWGWKEIAQAQKEAAIARGELKLKESD